MNLYIFKPADNWDYCGGAVIATAESFQQAADVVVEYYSDLESARKAFVYEKDELVPENAQGWDIWVLDKTFEVVNATKTEVVFDNFNWA